MFKNRTKGVKMRFNQAYETLQNLIHTDINQAELGRVLGVSRANINYKKQANVLLSDEDVKKIETYYKVPLTSDTSLNNILSFPAGDRIEINYWKDLPEDLKNPRIVSVWFDKEIIENAWGMSAEHLCIIPMIGDKMAHYWYPIRPNDILIVDTSHNYIMGNGVYFATSRNNSRFWIREMQVLINNDVEFKGFSPSGETTKIFTPQDLENVDFKLIGKVIKNVSFRL